MIYLKYCSVCIKQQSLADIIVQSLHVYQFMVIVIGPCIFKCHLIIVFNVCHLPKTVVYIQLLKYLENNFMSVIPHERELRQVNHINYTILDAVGKPNESIQIDANKKQESENGKFKRRYKVLSKRRKN